MLGILPNFWYPVLAPLERYGFIVLFVLFYIGNQIGRAGERTITSEMISPTRELLYRILF